MKFVMAGSFTKIWIEEVYCTTENHMTTIKDEINYTDGS